MNSENTIYKENDLVTLNIKSFNKMGLSISNLDGKPVEILGGIPQEKVEVRLLRIYPDKIISIVNKVIESSEFRVNAPCVKFLECTGCQWQHIDYKYQLILKKEDHEVVEQNIEDVRTEMVQLMEQVEGLSKDQLRLNQMVDDIGQDDSQETPESEPGSKSVSEPLPTHLPSFSEIMT